MTKYHPPTGWLAAMGGAFLLAVVTAGVVTAACLLSGGNSLSMALAFGGLVGVGVAAFMLWLFYWRQVTAQEIGKSIGALWREFGKY